MSFPPPETLTPLVLICILRAESPDAHHNAAKRLASWARAVVAAALPRAFSPLTSATILVLSERREHAAADIAALFEPPTERSDVHALVLSLEAFSAGAPSAPDDMIAWLATTLGIG